VRELDVLIFREPHLLDARDRYAGRHVTIDAGLVFFRLTVGVLVDDPRGVRGE
jgi:hypothetical protein